MRPQMISINDEAVLSVKVVENNEPCVSLLDLPLIYVPSQIVTKIGIGDSTTPYARITIKNKLKKVLKLLPTGYGLLLIEGYRRYENQKYLYEKRFNALKIEKPDHSEMQLHGETRRFVSDPDVFSPHVTGGAIDIGIVNDKKELLDVGNLFEYTDTASTDCGSITTEQKNNRKLLIKVMEQVGFVNYPFEWWHWSYGDKYWGYVTGNNAVYDSLKQKNFI